MFLHDIPSICYPEFSYEDNESGLQSSFYQAQSLFAYLLSNPRTRQPLPRQKLQGKEQGLIFDQWSFQQSQFPQIQQQ